MKNRYKLKNTGYSSKRFGRCEVCGGYCNEVYYQQKATHFKFKDHNGNIHEGWSAKPSLFGHKECLLASRD